MTAIRAVTFDFGQTLASLDTALLCRKLGRVGVEAPEERLDAGLSAAWSAYDHAVRAGVGGHPWRVLMRALLVSSATIEGKALDEVRLSETVEWLWSEQPKENLWRRPIPGMIELCEDLVSAGVPLGILSNSEGKLRELIAEMGLSSLLTIVADSGRLGIEKPDPRIFEWIANELATDVTSIVHVGDSLEADVEGAVAVGMRAIWFSQAGAGGRADRSRLRRPELVHICADASEVRGALHELGLRF